MLKSSLHTPSPLSTQARRVSAGQALPAPAGGRPVLARAPSRGAPRRAQAQNGWGDGGGGGGYGATQVEERVRAPRTAPGPAPPQPPGGGGGPSGGGPGGGGGMSTTTKALIAGAFIFGIGTGVWFASDANFYPSNVASTSIVDRQTPNSEVCVANGYSSMVFDQRIYVSFNPFNVYVAQPEVKPGCVVRRANIALLEKRRLVTDKEVSACTKNMNTFAFVGDLEKSPEVSCVYHSEEAENQFLKDPRRANLGDGFRPPPEFGGSKSAGQDRQE